MEIIIRVPQAWKELDDGKQYKYGMPSGYTWRFKDLKQEYGGYDMR